MTSAPDYYEILQVSPKADAEIIQAAYRRLAQKWHPDKNPGDPFAYERMRLLNEAYETLSDARRRKEYDARRAGSPTDESANENTVAARAPTAQSAGSGTHPTCAGGSPVCEATWLKVVPDGRAIWVSGGVLFLIGHGDACYERLLLTSFVWAVLFGVPVYFCVHAGKPGVTKVIGILCLLAAGLDVAVPLYAGHELESVSRESPPPLPQLPERINVPGDFWTLPAHNPEFLADQASRGKPWEETAQELRHRRTQRLDQYRQLYELHLQANRLQEARGKLTANDESLIAYSVRRSIPIGSTISELRQVSQYRDAVKRFNAGKANNQDIEVIARFEWEQGINQKAVKVEQ